MTVIIIYLTSCPLATQDQVMLSQKVLIWPSFGSQLAHNTWSWTIPPSKLPKQGQMFHCAGSAVPSSAPVHYVCDSLSGCLSACISLDEDVWSAAWRFSKQNFALIKSKSASGVSIPYDSEQNLHWLQGGQPQPFCSFSQESHTCHLSFWQELTSHSCHNESAGIGKHLHREV